MPEYSDFMTQGPTLIRERAAQSIRGRRFLNAYACVRCGCEMYRTEWAARRYGKCLACRRMKHGHTTKTVKSAIYSVWQGMISRCEYKRSERYKHYGERGITVCEGWHDFDRFLEWAESVGWRKGMQIDRIDNDLGYCPSNCRIVTPQENMQNSRCAKLCKEDVRCIRMLRWSGLTSQQVASIFSVNKETVKSIMRLQSWSNV